MQSPHTRAVIQVVESNSFYKAARLLKLSPASVTRKIAKLESQLGVTLLNRNTRGFSLTDHGEYCYQQCQNIPAILSGLTNDLTNKVNEPTGVLNISVSCYSGYIELLPIIAKFLQAYPHITIQFVKSNIYPDLLDSFDVYFRYNEINTRALQSQKLIDHQLICCATPDYLKKQRAPLKPTDLAQHNCIVHQVNLYEGEVWHFKDKQRTITLKASGNLRINNSALVLEAVLQGAGIARLPSYFFEDAMKEGKLIEVLADFRSSKMTVWLVHPRQHLRARKHQVFIDFVLKEYQKINQLSI